MINVNFQEFRMNPKDQTREKITDTSKSLPLHTAKKLFDSTLRVFAERVQVVLAQCDDQHIIVITGPELDVPFQHRSDFTPAKDASDYRAFLEYVQAKGGDIPRAVS